MTATAAARVGLVAGAALVGWASTGRQYDVTQPWTWGSDIAVTLAFAIVAALALPRAPRIALLTAAVCVAWCLPAWVELTLFWHRAVIIHLLIVLIAGSTRLWPPSRIARATIVAGYAISATPYIWATDAAAIAIAIAVGAAGVVVRRRAGSASRTPALAALVVLVVLVIAGAVTDAANPSPVTLEVRAVIYALGLVVVAVLTGGAERSTPLDAATDAVVELGAQPDDAVRERLASALGDDTLVVGWWSQPEAGFIAADGQTITAPAGRMERSAVRVEIGSRPVALVVGDATRMNMPGVREAIVRGSRLAGEHDLLVRRIRRASEEVERSRARLIRAAEAERRSLAAELESEVGARLRSLRARVQEAGEGAPALRRAETLSGRALAEFDAIARGLNPSALERGLSGALSGLVERTPVAMALRVDAGADRDPLAAQVAYYVCAEAVANAVRHAECSSISIGIAVHDDQLEVAVDDDGRGGAADQPGSGLSGLRQRVATHGGILLIDSPVGEGTHIRALLPVARVATAVLEVRR